MKCPNCGCEDAMHSMFEEEEFFWCGDCGADLGSEVANEKEEQMAWEVMEDAIGEEQDRQSSRDEAEGKHEPDRVSVLGGD